MGAMQRQKGAAFERDVARDFNTALGGDADWRRHLGQARDGGMDIRVGPLVVECKRRKSLATMMGWLDQATAACRPDADAAPDRDIPVVVARQDNDEAVVILRFRDFLDLTRDELNGRIAEARTRLQLQGIL
jgi:hypothetical protein